MTSTEIITEFAEEAAYLRRLRTIAVDAPHFTLRDLARHDKRIEARIDGLRLAGEEGWKICEQLLGSDAPEEYFAPSILALESDYETRIKAVMDAVNDNQERTRVLLSALGWLTYEQAEPQINKFLADESPFKRYIGIAASALHRHDPEHHLNNSIYDTSPLLKARGLRAYGELGRIGKLHLYKLLDNLTADDAEVRFSAAWSAAILGGSEAVEVLKNFVTPDSPYNEKALNTALRRMEKTAAISWQKELAKSPDTIRLAVVAAGIIGDPALVPWLMDQMNTPALARVSGEAFTMITGIDNDQAEMKGTRPEGFNAGPNDDPKDNNVTMDPDELLPWPNTALLAAWWNNNQGNYPVGVRYILGKPVTIEHLRQVLKTRFQRQRAAAALELAIMQPGQSLFNVRSPGFRQCREVNNP